MRERRQRREDKEGFGSGGIFLMDVAERWLMGSIYMPKVGFATPYADGGSNLVPRFQSALRELKFIMANC